jgi:hypothetical protein
LEDEQCPICKAELDEILITEDKEMTWSFFDKKLRKKCEEDPEDDSETNLFGLLFENS